jgi:hypothetical protein
MKTALDPTLKALERHEHYDLENEGAGIRLLDEGWARRMAGVGTSIYDS